MQVERWVGIVAAVALAAGCGSGSTTVGTASVPDPGGGSVDGGGGGGGATGSDGGVPIGGNSDGGATSVPDGGGTSDGGTGATVAPCSPTPEVIGANFGPATADDRYVYGWGDQRIARIPIGGGPAETVIGGIDVTADWSLTVDDSQLYWIWQDWRAATPRMVLLRAPKTGGAAVVVTDQATGFNVVTDRDSLYYVTATQPRALMRAPKHGGSATILSNQAEGVQAVDAHYAYWFIGEAGGGAILVRRAPLDGGPSETIGSWPRYGDSGPARVITDGRALYGWDFGRIVRADLASGTVTTLYDPQQRLDVSSGNRPGFIAIDDDAIYWVTNADYEPPITHPIHFVDRVGKDGSGAVTLASSIHGGNHIAVAGDSVYYDEGTTLYRRCKR